MLTATVVARIGLIIDVLGVLLVATDLLRPDIAERAEERVREAYLDVVSNPDGRLSGLVWSPILLALDLFLLVFSRGNHRQPVLAKVSASPTKKPQVATQARTERPRRLPTMLQEWASRIAYSSLNLVLTILFGVLATTVSLISLIVLLPVLPVLILLGGFLYLAEASMLGLKGKVGFRGALPAAGLTLIVIGFLFQIAATFM